MNESPTAFMRSLQAEAGRRRIPLHFLPNLDKGRGYVDGVWLDIRTGGSGNRFEMFEMARAAKTPLFDTFDREEAFRLIFWHAEACVKKDAAWR